MPSPKGKKGPVSQGVDGRLTKEQYRPTRKEYELHLYNAKRQNDFMALLVSIVLLKKSANYTREQKR